MVVNVSPEPFRYDFEIPNNSDYVKAWTFLDEDTGTSIFSVSDAFELSIKTSRDIGAAVAVHALQTADPLVTGFINSPTIDSDGTTYITIRRTDLEGAMPAGSTGRMKFYFDFRRISSDGMKQTLSYGELTMNMGVSAT